MWTAGRLGSVTGVDPIDGARRAVPAPVLVGAVCGLAWAASLRVLMAEFAGPESTFDWFGTFEGVLLPGAVVGALLGWAAHPRGRAPRWLVAAPLVFVLFTPSVFVDGLGGGAIAVPLLGMAGGYALASRGPRWARWAAGAVALLAVPGWLVLASFAGGSLPVLVVDDIEIHGLLPRFDLAQVDGLPAHHGAVPDPPQPGADVTSVEPHPAIRTLIRLWRHQLRSVRAATRRPLSRSGLIRMNRLRVPEAQGTTPPTAHIRARSPESATASARPCTTTLQPRW